MVSKNPPSKDWGNSVATFIMRFGIFYLNDALIYYCLPYKEGGNSGFPFIVNGIIG
jgi:hypothetical protein